MLTSYIFMRAGHLPVPLSKLVEI